MYRRILVAMDSSDLAKKALDRAVKLAQLTDSEIYVVTVMKEKS